jgi:hypothetical protein
MAVQTANLTIVFMDLKGYTARTAMQTREEHVEWPCSTREAATRAGRPP